MVLEFIEDIKSAGITTEEAAVYEILLRGGALTASQILKFLPAEMIISRSVIYRVLDDLIQLDLIEKHDAPGAVARFSAKHPSQLTKVIEAERAKYELAKEHLATTTGQLSSLFNLIAGKPGVQFYEGKDGLWEVLLDSLTATEEILTYADLEAIDKYIPDLNAEYSTLREDKQVRKRGLVIESPQARRFLSSYTGNVTHTKLIKSEATPVSFNTVMQIYDNKISYLTLTDVYLVGVIITDQHIANTHKYLFESLWKLSSGEVI